jgi:nitroreductase/dihydropteridine reductase
MNNEIHNELQWRYATKKFDATKKINDQDLETLLEVMRMSPSSMGLQTTHVLVITDAEIRTQLTAHSYNQQQVKDASHLIVLCSYSSLDENYIQSHAKRTDEAREMGDERLRKMIESIGNFLGNKSPEAIHQWTSNQTYIVLGQLLSACARLKIDATPMEGFNPKGYDELLHLSEKNLIATVACPIGYRSEDDAFQHLKKVRKENEDYFTFI